MIQKFLRVLSGFCKSILMFFLRFLGSLGVSIFLICVASVIVLIMGFVALVASVFIPSVMMDVARNLKENIFLDNYFSKKK